MKPEQVMSPVAQEEEKICPCCGRPGDGEPSAACAAMHSDRVCLCYQETTPLGTTRRKKAPKEKV